MRQTLVLVAACLFAGGFVRAVHAQTPDQQAVIAEYVAAFNDGDAAMQRFFEARAGTGVPIATRLQRYRQMRGDMGTLTVRRIVSSTAQAVTAEVAGSQGTVATFIFNFGPGSPARFLGLNVRLGDVGEEVAAPALAPRDEATAIHDIEALVARAATADDFSGTVLLAKRGAVVWQTAVGLADREQKIANTLDTRFNLGSIGKSFTTVAIAQLVAAGKLNPADTVGRFLPDYPNATVRSTVTVQMLLDMRAGIGDFFGDAYERMPKRQLRTLADYLPLFAGEPLQFAPGTGQRYSNGGFVVLGLIVQQASGMDYYDYIQRHVFDAAGMRDSGFFRQSATVPRRANGYTRRLGAERQINTSSLPERASSAGGVYATAADLLRYDQALAAGTLVSAAAMQQIGKALNGQGLAGGAPGVNATLDQDVNGYTVIVLANDDPPAAERLARGIRLIADAVK